MDVSIHTWTFFDSIERFFQEYVTIGWYEAFDDNGSHGGAFKAEVLKQHDRWQILAATFGAQHFTTFAACQVCAVVHHCSGNTLSEMRWAHHEETNGKDFMGAVRVFPWYVAKFWWLDLIKDDASVDGAFVVVNVDDAGFYSTFNAAVRWKNASLKCCIGVDLFFRIENVLLINDQAVTCLRVWLVESSPTPPCFLLTIILAYGTNKIHDFCE